MKRKDDVINNEVAQSGRQDDWMSKELGREKKLTPWAFDQDDYEKQIEDKSDRRTSIWLIIDFILAIGIAFINMQLGNGAYWPSVMLILMLSPGMFVWMFLFKRFMPAWYLMLGALIAVIFEIMILCKQV